MLAKTTNLSIKIDCELKAQADSLFNKMGMTLSTAVNVFVRQAVQKQAIPFPIYLEEQKERTLKDVLRETQAQAHMNGTSELTMDDINEITAEARQGNK